MSGRASERGSHRRVAPSVQPHLEPSDSLVRHTGTPSQRGSLVLVAPWGTILAAVLGLAACSPASVQTNVTDEPTMRPSGGTDADDPEGGDSDPAYQRWLTRDPLTSCGRHKLVRAESVANPPYAKCLRDAMSAGEGAEAIVTVTTVEGDPITSYLRVTATGDTEVYLDSTQDKFGKQAWRYKTCADLRVALRSSC